MKSYKALLDQYSDVQLVEFSKFIPSDSSYEKLVLFSNNWPEGKILELAAQGEVQNFLNSGSKYFESELYTTLRSCQDPRQYLVNPLPLFFRGSANVLMAPFYRKEDKLHLVAQVLPFLEQTGSRLVTEHARILFEELFMNAVFDAPSEAKKLGYLNKKARCEFMIAYDSEKLVVSCFDSYGSLNPQKMVVRMRDIQTHGTKNIINLSQRKGGAGIGCSLLYHYSSSMIIGVEAGVATRVTCSIPLRISQKNFYLLGKNLQIINLLNAGGNNGK